MQIKSVLKRFLSVWFRFGFLKNSDSVQNEFGSVWFKNAVQFGYTTHVIANITATADDVTSTSLLSVTTMTTSE